MSKRPELKCTTGLSTQEEADTFVILHWLELAYSSIEVDCFTQDTDWWVLLLRRLTDVGLNTCILTGNYEKQKLVSLKPIFEALGMARAKALSGFHALTSSDTTDRLKGVGKKTALAKLLDAPDAAVVKALIDLGKGEVPLPDVISGCEQFVCMLLSTRDVSATSAAFLSLRWTKFKKLKPTQGLISVLPHQVPSNSTFYKPIFKQVWAQDDVVNPAIYGPCKLGWCKN